MKRFTLRQKKNLIGYSFISLWIIGFLVFTIFPLGYSLFLSFQKVKITPKGIVTSFIGLENYEYAFGVDALFTQKLVGFLQELVISVPIIIVFSLIIAILLNQKIMFRGFFRTIFFLPVIITSGPVIGELMDQGVTSIPAIEEYAIFSAFLTNTDGFLNSIIVYLMDNLIVILWFSGVQILIFLAALQKTDSSMYEAAQMDGASVWESFWKITLPSIFPLIVVNLVYTIVMYSVFALNPIVEHIQSNMFQIDTGFGYASALSWVYFVLITIVLIVTVWLISIRNKRKYS